jgi:hypothetical protein
MVMFSTLRSATLRACGLAAVALLTACQTVEPKSVDSTLVATPALVTVRPSDIAVLPVEDGTPDAAFSRHLTYLRQEVMRQLVDRLYVPITAAAVDVALATKVSAVEASTRKDSMLAPAVLRTYAGHAKEDAVFAVRIDRWDESMLLVDKRVRFQMQAAMMSSAGEQLWSGTLRGEIKAGGIGAAPRDKDGMARSCIGLAVEEMLAQLPQRKL